MEYTDRANLGSETLQDQFKNVKAKTEWSEVQQWGQLAWTNEAIGNFESGQYTSNESSSFWDILKSMSSRQVKNATKWDEITSSRKDNFAVDSRDVKLHYLYVKVREDPSVDNMKALEDELQYRTEIDNLFAEVFPVHAVTVKNKPNPNPTDFDCLRSMVNHFESHCLKLDGYSLKWAATFTAECESTKAVPAARELSLEKMANSCLGNTFIQQLRENSFDPI